MRKLLWIFLVLVNCDLWAANGGAGDEPSRAVAAAACERPDSPDDYKFSTLAEAIEFCQSITRDNIIWITELQEYWKKPENVEAVKKSLKNVLTTYSMSHIDSLLGYMLSAYTEEKETWEECLINAECLLEGVDDPDEMPTFLNETIQSLTTRSTDLVSLCYGQDNPKAGYIAHLYPGNLENTKAQLDSLKTIFKTLLPFSVREYQVDYATTDFKYIGTGRVSGTGTGDHIDLGTTPKCEREGEFLDIVTPSGQHVKLPLEKELALFPRDFISRELLKISIRRCISELTITFPSKLKLTLNNLSSGQAAKYSKAYMEAKAAYAAEVMAAKAAYAAEVMAAKAEAELLAAEPTKPRSRTSSKKAEREASRLAAEAAAREKAEREADAALEVARAAEMAAAKKAATEADRKSHAAVTLALVARQTKPVPLEMGLGGAATTATLPRPHIGSRELSPDNQDMLLTLMSYESADHPAAPVRSYNWHQLENLLGNLGFTRKGTNFVGFDTTGKCKQIGLHYLHGDRSLNPDLVQIMFKQLHASVGWGREALGHLAGIAEPLAPWPWEPVRRG